LATTEQRQSARSVEQTGNSDGGYQFNQQAPKVRQLVRPEDGARTIGGRKAGTPNRKTCEIGELLESLKHNPIEAMVQIATDPEASLELRGRMNAELAQYVYPKRKSR
jgi:hypothetical protein